MIGNRIDEEIINLIGTYGMIIDGNGSRSVSKTVVPNGIPAVIEPAPILRPRNAVKLDIVQQVRQIFARFDFTHVPGLPVRTPVRSTVSDIPAVATYCIRSQ